MGLAVMLFIVYMLIDSISNEGLVNAYCQKYAKENSPKSLDAGLYFRDKGSEQDFYDECLEAYEGATVRQILVKYLTGDTEPKVDDEYIDPSDPL